jgi:hypothetical protein
VKRGLNSWRQNRATVSFIEDVLAAYVRSMYPVKKQALRMKNVIAENAGRPTSDSIDEYNKLLGVNPRRRGAKVCRQAEKRIIRLRNKTEPKVGATAAGSALSRQESACHLSKTGVVSR